MIWPSRAPQSTLSPSPPYLTWDSAFCLSHYFSTLPSLPTPQQLILEYHIRSHHQPTFRSPPITALFYAQPPALDSANNPSLPFFLPAIPFTTSASYKLYPTSGGGVVILTDVATLRRAHHRPFKKYSVGNRTASGTRTRIFDLSKSPQRLSSFDIPLLLPLSFVLSKQPVQQHLVVSILNRIRTSLIVID